MIGTTTIATSIELAGAEPTITKVSAAQRQDHTKSLLRPFAKSVLAGKAF
jgi:hypothetical protein